MCFNIVDILHVSAHFSIIINNIFQLFRISNKNLLSGELYHLDIFYFAQMKIIYIKINFNSDIQNMLIVQDEYHIYKAIICMNYIFNVHYQHIKKFGVKK